MDQIDQVLTRGVEKIFPSKTALEKVLRSGRKIRLYQGFDPTGDKLHIGHLVGLMKLRQFQDLGHEVIFLIGDGTGMAGDPSGRVKQREGFLTRNTLRENAKDYILQADRIVRFSGINAAKILYNGDWLTKLTFTELLELFGRFSIQQLIERDIFQKRIKENKPLHLHELFYPIMQGYDSVALNADIEIGGTDQTFNMLAGRILVKNIQNREKFVITTTLLENPVTGEKLMSKSLGTGIGLNESPMNMYGKAMSLPDEVITRCFIDCTFWPVDKIKKTEKEIGKLKPRDFKMMLAHEIVKMYHGEKKAGEAEEFFIKTFQKKEIPEEIPEIRAEKGEKLADVLIKEGIIKSKSEWRRLVDEQAIHDLGNKIEINDYHFKVEKETILKIGKKRFIKIKQ